ncbi:type IV pilin-like G/H family protein [Stenomitos frigidus]|nr:type IV pilin-like G/H family protein [Stenomitos frigidus]
MKILLTNVCVQLAIAITLAACNTSRPFVTASPSPDILSSSPVASSPSPTPTTGDPFAKGVDKAASATSLAQSAQTPEDWNLVLAQWQRAIAFMKAVPPTSPNRAAAQALLAKYQQNLARAQQQAKQGGPSSVTVARKDGQEGVPLIAGGQPSASPDIPKNAVATMEAPVTISALLQQQAEFFAKQKRFAANLAELGTNIPGATLNYTYSTSGAQSKQATATATAKQGDLPSYTGAVFAVKDNKNNNQTVATICFSSTPPKTPPPPPQLVGKDAQCPTGSSKM